VGKKSGSGMDNPNHISESLETIFWVKILEFFDADPGSIHIRNPGWKIFESGIRDGKIRNRDKHPRSATLKTIVVF
jgi:hypothetical protein